jgi:hypothetical protein
MSDRGLNGHHARVLREIFAHPLAHNLEWPDVVSLIGSLGSAQLRHDGKYDFQIGSVNAVFAKPRHKDLGVDDLIELRRFLKEAGVDGKSAPDSAGKRTAEQIPTVVLIDHASARFFQAEQGGPHFEERDHIEPNDPHGFERHLEHRKEAHYKGERVPEASEFYERIAQRLKDVPSIVLAGDAKGKSSAAAYLAEFLEEKHKEVSERVVAIANADLSSITLLEIERIAQTRR